MIPRNYQDSLKHILFNTFKTDNMILDGIITTIILGLFGKLIQLWQDCEESGWQKMKQYFTNYVNRPNQLILTGQNCTIPTNYGDLNVSSVYSNRFNAVLDYIVKNVNNGNIHEVKELFSNNINNKYKEKENFSVCQFDSFSIDPDIYFQISYEDYNNDNNKGASTRIEKIKLYVYSYKYTLNEIICYVESIMENYQKEIHEDRKMKQFIYSAVKTTIKEDEDIYNRWDEQIFNSNRTFSNLFLENKEELLDKINFFLENKSWYDEKGIPYNLGIGLHGAPGTGKTSFIKALANKTGRDIVRMPLKIIHTKTDLEKLFYESTYNKSNEENSKTFDKKIILFEDIDCIGDIVRKRKYDSEMNNKTPPNEILDTMNETQQLIHTMNKMAESNNTATSSTISPSMLYNDPLTLDDFLNLWDGVRETPGRIIIITSNHYDKLDPALIRPGRIDISYECKMVNHKVLQEMHQCFFQTQIPTDTLKNIKEYYFTPAEIMNIYMTYKNDQISYLSRLLHPEDLNK